TLTKGVPSVTDIIAYDGNENDLLRITAAIEKNSQHPLASAIIRKAEESNLNFNELLVEDFQSITGKGVKATVNNTLYYVGSPNLFTELHSDIDIQKEQEIAQLQEQGKTVMRSEEHTSELQSRFDLVCRLLLEK